MVPTILVPGTWGDSQAWWREGSPFWIAARHVGIPLQNSLDAYNWTTEVDGILGKNRDWETAGDALRWYSLAKGHTTVNVVAHSHGGQVALHGAAESLRIDTLITVATPVRRDMEEIAKKARRNIKLWMHLQSDSSDLMQWLGELMDGRIGIYRQMPLADKNIMEPGVGHSGLLDPGLWTKRGWWTWLT